MSEGVTSAAPKPKKSVALSGVPAGNTALCTVGRRATTCTTAATTSWTSPTRRSSRKWPICWCTGSCRLPPSSRPTSTSCRRSAACRPHAGLLECIPANTHPMDVLRTGCSALGTLLPETQRPQDRRGAQHRRPADGQLRLDAAVLVSLLAFGQAHRARDRRRLHRRSFPAPAARQEALASCGCAPCTPRSSSMPSTSSTPPPSPAA